MKVSELKGKALKDYAKQVNLKGRSTMNANQLREALQALDSTQPLPEPVKTEPKEEPVLQAEKKKRNWHTFRQELSKQLGVSVVEAGKLGGKGGKYNELYQKYKDCDNYQLKAEREAEKPEPEPAE